jgi:hypothetical protein
MRIGILADIHEQDDELRRAVAVLKQHGADRLVVLGDVFDSGRRLEVTVDLLVAAGAVGVWGNHDFGLCGGNLTAEDRQRYGEHVLAFLDGLRPRLEIEGCLFTHVEPWLDPEKIEDLWYFEGPPETPEQVARSFSAVPNRVMFMGHDHCWRLISPEGVQPWSGERPITLRGEERYLVTVHAVCCGKCALFDTGTRELTPFDIGFGG